MPRSEILEMPEATRRRFPRFLLFLFAVMGAGPCLAADVAANHPRIAGFQRFADRFQADKAGPGLLLLGELNCASCHKADPGLLEHLSTKTAPILDKVGDRVRPEYYKTLLSDPRAAKPGTTMPNLFEGWDAASKNDAIEALTHFLASTGTPRSEQYRPKNAERGKALYARVGCVACHGPVGETLKGEAKGLVSFGNLSTKYSIPSLAAFLKEPHESRPSGRMPSLSLQDEEAKDVANFLLADLKSASRPNLAYRYFEGEWNKLPDFAALKPAAEGTIEGFDVSVAKRNDNMALEFQGYLHVKDEGEYTFFLTSDDGSKLFLDDQLAVDNDGIHPPTLKEGKVRLKPGVHKLVVGVFNGGAGVEVDLEIQGPNLSRRPALDLITMKADESLDDGTKGRFQVNPALAAKGKDLFSGVGCASCHQLKADGAALASKDSGKPLSELLPEKGCLAGQPAKGKPSYSLDPSQVKAIAQALSLQKELAARKPTANETIHRKLVAFNCYACHVRGGEGGVEEPLNAYFETTQKEMGDEGRLPPHLDLVGAKLNPNYLKTILRDGAKDRPYVLTRMPRFSDPSLVSLADALIATDHVEPFPVQEFSVSARRVESDGRTIIGADGLGCVKCHTFRGIEAQGIQAIDMTTFNRRLSRDWFARYVVNPPLFRPGTRMPTGWPDGKSMMPKVLGGDTSKQIESVWRYLAEGGQADPPSGIGRQSIPIYAIKDAVIYRNFIQGAGPRAIGVGYPERANIAFDANNLRLALIWQGGFMDASRHWTGRGEGFQPPMGGNVIAMPEGPSFAKLPSLTEPWPSKTARELGQKFKGYTLDAAQRPTFRYEVEGVKIQDKPVAVAGENDPTITRTLTFEAEKPVDNLWFRVLAAKTVVPLKDGWYRIDDDWKLQIQGSDAVTVRKSNGVTEILVPIRLAGKPLTLIERFEW